MKQSIVMRILHKDNLIPFIILASLLIYWTFGLIGAELYGSLVLLMAVVIGVVPLAKNIVTAIFRRHFGVDVLAIIAILAALFLGEYVASAVVLLMLSGGEALENYALKRARKELTSLLSNAPRIAHVKRDGVIEDVHVDEVKVSDTLVVKPGEIIPVDGKVIEGTSQVDESTLTGESIPVEKMPRSMVFSGSVNSGSVLEIEATKLSRDSKYSQIVRLVQEAERSKAPFVRLADRYSVWFTGVSLIIALLAWLTSGELVRAVAVLVVATPCPLILATPIAFASGISKAAKRGVIIKHGGVVEKLAEAKCFLFDKTGTITFGTPRITKVVTYADYSEDDALRFAASLDQLSNHILARAFLSHAKSKRLKKLSIPADFEEALGNGVRGIVDQHQSQLGRLSYLTSGGVEIPPEIAETHALSKNEGVMTVYLAVDGRLAAAFEFADTIRDDVKDLFARLKKYKEHLVMITGDKERVAQHIGEQAGIDKIYAECMPECKVRLVQNERKDHHPAVMIGDGVNDAPALASADVGIAMGGHGSSAASESGDVVVMVDTIERVGEIFELSKRVLAIAKQSIFIGIGLSIGLMIVASLGYIKPVYGALMQEAIDVLVILNALRVHTEVSAG